MSDIDYSPEMHRPPLVPYAAISPLDLKLVAECRRELLNVVIDFAKGIRGQFPAAGFANHRAACDEVLDDLVALRAGRVEVEDELQLRLFDRPSPQSSPVGRGRKAAA